ncbi:lipocalin family protein [Haematospirillum sp. H1815]|uniref:lipocalin family protein n=1 Tax=Haematospirillum sp. H1815 TaxID=2723108 RepID=UPI00143B1BD0|nr:lipocalin family protein [Haematospirillum sp. H1815]NKD77670.1 lipocalin family protein [Haematospirillum sp. H1815]
MILLNRVEGVAMKRYGFVAVVVSGLLVGCGPKVPPVNAPPTAGPVDMDRYMGTWYEIASLPAPFQEGCVATTAKYEKTFDGTIEVTNRCLHESFRGREREAKGTAHLDPLQPDGSRLFVSFFPFTEGAYWVLALDAGYRWSVVGSPDRRYLWILSRTPTMSKSQYEILKGKAERLGYPVSKLVLTQQPPIP